MEGPPSSTLAASVRRNNDRGYIRDGIGVDGEWEHHGIC